jgi:hypothetical protein
LPRLTRSSPFCYCCCCPSWLRHVCIISVCMHCVLCSSTGHFH